MAAEIGGPGSRRDRRTPVVLRCEVLAILAGHVLVLSLHS
jgi:hypothetical protein